MLLKINNLGLFFVFSSISDYKKTINVIVSTTLWSLLTIYMLAKIIFRIRVKELGKKKLFSFKMFKRFSHQYVEGH